MPMMPGSKAPGMAGPAPAAPADPNKVILTIGSEKITAGQFETLVDALPPQYQNIARGPRKREFAESLIGTGEDRQLSMAPSRLQEFIGAVRTNFERFAMQGETPVLLTSPTVRPYVRSIIDRFRPMTVVMSQNEIHPKAKIRTIGQV